MHTNKTNRWTRLLCAALAAGTLGVAALPASADSRDGHRKHHDKDTKVRVGIGLNLGGGRGPRYEERKVKVWVEPVYRTVTDRVWVEPTYRTVTDRVWREPVTEVRVERAWVPDRYEWRTFYRRNHRGDRIKVREKVLVEKGRYERRETQFIVKPGFFENIERREIDQPGRFNVVERRELVTPGHFEWRTERVAVDRGRRDTVVGLGVDWDLD